MKRRTSGFFALLLLVMISLPSLALEGGWRSFSGSGPYGIGPVNDVLTAVEDQPYSNRYFAVMGGMTLNSLTTDADWLTASYTGPLTVNTTDIECQYTFDLGDATDSSGNGHNGVVYGATSVTGIFDNGGAMSFDGDDYITIPHDPALNITDEITVEAWIYPTFTDSKEHMVLSKGGSWGDDDPQDYELTMDRDRPLFQIKVPFSSDWYGAAPLNPISKNTWHHVAGTYDGARFRIYIDGINQTSLYTGWDTTYKGSVYSGGLPTSMDDISIGRRKPASWGSLFFVGSIDQVRIYSRALPPEEVLEHATKPGERTLTISGVPDNGDVGTRNVNLNITDGQGRYAERSFSLKIRNDAPRILTTNIDLAVQNEPYLRDYDSDDEGQGTWMLSTDALWLSIDPSSGVLAGIPGPWDIGTFSVNVSFDDGNGGKASTQFDLEVLNVNDPPVILTSNVRTAVQGEVYLVDYQAEEIDEGDVGTWSVFTTVGFLSMDQDSGMLSGTPDNEDVGVHNVTVTVTDTSGASDTTSFDLEVLNVNDAPGWSIVPENSSVNEGALYSFDADALDVDIGDILSYSLTSDPPSNASINSTTGLIEWLASRTPFEAPPYRLELTVTASDGIFSIEHDFHLDVILKSSPYSFLSSPVNGSTIPSTTAVLDWKGYFFTNEGTGYELYLSTERSSVLWLDTAALLERIVLDVGPQPEEIGTTRDGAVVPPMVGPYSYTLSDLKEGATYYWTVIPFDHYSRGNCMNGTMSFYVNIPPKTFTASPAEDEKVPTTDIALSWTKFDTESDPVRCDIYLSKVLAEVTSMSDSALTAMDLEGTSYTVDALEPGSTYYWSVVPDDGWSMGVCNDRLPASFLVNTPPSLVDVGNRKATALEKLTIDVNFTDPDTADLDKTVFSLDVQLPGASIDAATGVLTWTPTLDQVGLHTIIIGITDGQDPSNTTFVVDVLAPPVIEEEDDDKGLGIFLWVIVIAAVLVLLAAVLLVIFMLLKRRVEEEIVMEEEEEAAEAEQELASMFTGGAPAESETPAVDETAALSFGPPAVDAGAAETTIPTAEAEGAPSPTSETAMQQGSGPTPAPGSPVEKK